MTKVLLVEDDNNLREIYEARLQAEGYTIVSARDGEEALVVAKAEKPDLIISDIMMPKISGFEMLDILRNTDELKAVKIIMLTALGQSDDQQRADKLGADRYLVKSQVTLEDIVRVAHELLQDSGGAGTTPATTTGATDTPATPAPTPSSSEPTATETPAASADTNAKPEVPSAEPAPETPPISEDKPAETPSDNSASDDTAQKIDVSAPDLSGSANGATSTAGMDSSSDEPKSEVQTDVSAPTDASSSPTEAAVSDTTADAKPESTAQEEAQLEAQIEDFVAGAEEQPNVASAPAETTDQATAETSPDATTTSDSVTEPETTSSDTAVEQAEPSPSDTPSVAEDQASGAPSLSPSEKAEAETAAETADAALVDSAVKSLEDSSEEKAGDADSAAKVLPDSASEKKGGERVIQPLDSEPKTDINELLAKEEAEVAKAQAVAPESVINPAPASQENAGGVGPAKISSPPPAAPGQVDPNSIAL